MKVCPQLGHFIRSKSIRTCFSGGMLLPHRIQVMFSEARISSIGFLERGTFKPVVDWELRARKLMAFSGELMLRENPNK
jgi:hypothetical protein